MKCNLALWDRTFRFILAVLLLTYVIAGGPFWGWGGIYLLMTAAWGLCPLYAFFKIKTIRNPSVGGASISRAQELSKKISQEIKRP